MAVKPNRNHGKNFNRAVYILPTTVWRTEAEKKGNRVKTHSLQTDSFSTQQPNWKNSNQLMKVINWLTSQTTPRRMINEWYAMGDAARIDEDGIVTVLGRFEDIETLEGESIYPAEIESEFVALDEVSEAAVFVAEVNGRPSLLALLVLNDSRTEEAVNLTTIHEIITRRLRSKPAPNIIYVVPELPHLSGGGKLARNFIKRNWKELVTSLYPNFNRTKAGTEAMPHKRPAEADSYRLTKGDDAYAF